MLSLPASTLRRPPSAGPSPCASSAEPGDTFWERVAQTRWGRYVTAIEREAVLTAAARFAAPGAGLEIGCEGGRWCRLLTERGWAMAATETNPQALELCQRRSPSVSCLLVHPDDEQVPLGSSTVELLLCIEVPSLARDWLLAEARRLVKPGGMLVGVVLNACSWRGWLNRAKSRLTGTEPLYRSSYGSLRRSLQQHGFQVLTQRGCCWAPFSRKSNSRWIPLSTAAERLCGLHRITVLSPWVVFSAIRN